MIEMALGSPAAVAEVDRRLAAGESVEMEDVRKAIEAPGEPLTIDAVCQAVNGKPTGATLEPQESQKRCLAFWRWVPVSWHDQPSCEMGLRRGARPLLRGLGRSWRACASSSAAKPEAPMRSFPIRLWCSFAFLLTGLQS